MDHRDGPLTASPDKDAEDRRLAARARSGEREALDELVRRHQGWIYNIAVRMLYHPEDAQDATQEILIKAITHLSSFEGRSAFRTWLYRIAVRHVLNAKRGRREPEGVSFACYGHGLDATPDQELADVTSAPADQRLLVEEARIGCTAGMLLCLDRDQRLVYILGEIFQVSDTVASELLEVTSDNFRQRLARARRDLHSFMSDSCGLVDPANPCRCAKKTRGFIQAGYVDPGNLLFARDRVRRVHEIAPGAYRALLPLHDPCAATFRDHPFYDAPDLVPVLRRLISSPAFQRATELS